MQLSWQVYRQTDTDTQAALTTFTGEGPQMLHEWSNVTTSDHWGVRVPGLPSSECAYGGMC